MRRLLHLIIIALTASVVASCIDRPEIVLDEEQMVDVLVDVHRAEGLLEMQAANHHFIETEQYQKEVMGAVLQKHHVSRQQYDSSLMWYAQHLNLLTRVYGHVDERLKEEQERWGLLVTEQRDFDVSAEGDSVELWSLRPHLVLDPQRLADFRFWELPADSNYLEGDTLKWRFDVRQLVEGQQLVASISLTAAEKKPDPNRRYRQEEEEEQHEPVGSAQRIIDADGTYCLTVYADSLQPFGSAVFGFVLAHDSAHASPVFVDSISLLRLHIE